jgi:hypothetical protein
MGAAKTQMMMIIGGVITLVFGLLLADVLIDAAVTALTNASIGSFAGAASMGGLIPFLYFTLLIFVSIGLMTAGGVGIYRSSQG